ncbi:Crp/Fnr family transcriptional regulator [Flavobacterium sp. P21]|uniref:Crp/Fnr family transcriptional regulator n=1 Tax=Flavobacterium sp. P21 TaxID=3423948 RepID=UPI003D670CC2
MKKDLSLLSMQSKDILRKHIAKTISLTEEEFDYFFSFFKEHSFQKGQVIISAGETIDCEYFVLDGVLKSFYITDNLKMNILQFAMSTWWISDFEALYSGAKATINVDCISDAIVLSISNHDREKLCSEMHQVEYFFRWRTNKGYIASQKRLLSLMNSDAKHRYEELMEQYPTLYNDVPKYLIAAYLGVSRETLSRLYNS